MSKAAEDIRGILDILTESQQLLLEDQIDHILKNVPGGWNLIKYLRKYHLILHGAIFREVSIDEYFNRENYQDPNNIGIAISDRGCIDQSHHSCTGYIVDDGRIRDVHVSPTDMYDVRNRTLELIGNIRKAFICTNTEGQGSRQEINYRNDRDRRERWANNKVYKRLIVILVPMIKKRLLDIRYQFKDAVEKNNYKKAELLSQHADRLNRFVVASDASKVGDMPQDVGEIMGSIVENAYNSFPRDYILNFNYVAAEMAFAERAASGSQVELGAIYKEFKKFLNRFN